MARLLKGPDALLASNARDAMAAAAEDLTARRTVEMLLDHEERTTLLWRGVVPGAPPDYRFVVDGAAELAKRELRQRAGKPAGL